MSTQLPTPPPTPSTPTSASFAPKWDDVLGEMYLPLEGFPELRLTPYRSTDGPDMVRMSNDPIVGQWSYGRPNPYTLEDAESALKTRIPKFLTAIQAIRSHLSSPASRPPLHPIPLVALRTTSPVLDLPVGSFVGELFLPAHTGGGVSAEEMMGLPREIQVWELVYALLPVLHGRGIGSALVRAGLNWGEWLGIGTVVASAEPSNPASIAVLKKNGFSLRHTSPVPWPPQTGGGSRQVGDYERRLIPLRPHWDPERHEPFLPVPGFPLLRLTPWRREDIPEMVRLYNHPSVGKYAFRRSYPFAGSHAIRMLDDLIFPSSIPAETALRTYLSSANPEPLDKGSVMPTSVLRSSSASDPTMPAWKLLGNLGIFPPGNHLPLELAYDIMPELHGKGIGAAMLRAGLEGWVDWLQIPLVRACVQSDNLASGSVLRRNGFELAEKEAWSWPVEKGGGVREIGVWERRLPAPRPRPLWDAERGEPYLPVPGFPRLRMTPWREDDVPELVKLLNDPIVGKWSHRKPYPYKEADAIWYIHESIMPHTTPGLIHLRDLLKDTSTTLDIRSPTSEMPFPLGILRALPNSDPAMPAGKLLGKVGIFTDASVPGEELELGYDLMPALHGREIGSAMLKAVLDGWVDWLEIPRITANVQVDNPASGAILSRNGFVGVERKMWVWPEDKGGGEREVGKWERIASGRDQLPHD